MSFFYSLSFCWVVIVSEVTLPLGVNRRIESASWPPLEGHYFGLSFSMCIWSYATTRCKSRYSKHNGCNTNLRYWKAFEGNAGVVNRIHAKVLYGFPDGDWMVVNVLLHYWQGFWGKCGPWWIGYINHLIRKHFVAAACESYQSGTQPWRTVDSLLWTFLIWFWLQYSLFLILIIQKLRIFFQQEIIITEYEYR